MAEQDQEQNKSEQATPFKLAKAREKGAVARGSDLGFLVSLTVFVGFIWINGPVLWAHVIQATRNAVIAAPNALSGSQAILTVTGAVLWSVIATLIWLPLTVFTFVLVLEIVQTGPVFTTETLRVDLSRLSPANGFKRIFSVRLLIETAKNIAKMALYTAIAVLVIRYACSAVLPTLDDTGHLADAMATMALRLLVFFVLAAAAFAIIDQLIVRQDFARRMRMTRRDVRREARDREGEPRLKQRRKQLHRQLVKLSKSIRNIKTADVLITNPTHYAVALRYDAATMTAPAIVAQAMNHYALRLKRLAFIYGVTVIQNPALARSLYHQGEFEKEIPEAHFREVAEAYIAARRQSAPVELV